MPAVSGLLQALPDARFTVEKFIGGGDLVAVGVRGEGTHIGEVMGIAHTGKRIFLTESENFGSWMVGPSRAGARRAG